MLFEHSLKGRTTTAASLWWGFFLSFVSTVHFSFGPSIIILLVCLSLCFLSLPTNCDEVVSGFGIAAVFAVRVYVSNRPHASQKICMQVTGLYFSHARTSCGGLVGCPDTLFKFLSGNEPSQILYEILCSRYMNTTTTWFFVLFFNGFIK